MEVLNALKAIRVKIIQYNRKKNKYIRNYLTAKYKNDGQESITNSNLTEGEDCMRIFFDVDCIEMHAGFSDCFKTHPDIAMALMTEHVVPSNALNGKKNRIRY